MRIHDVDAHVFRGERWLVVEPCVSGHRREYLERIVEGAVAHDIHVVVGSSAEAAAAEVAAGIQARHGRDCVSVVLDDLPDACNTTAGAATRVRREFAYRRFFRRLYRAAQAQGAVDRVFVPYLDYCLYATALAGSPFGSTPYEGICMRPTFHFQRMGVVAPVRRSDFAKACLFKRLLRQRSLIRVFTIDETFYDYARHGSQRHAAKVHYFPDPGELVGTHTRESARAHLGIASDARVVLLYGSLDMRKGVRALLDWLMAPESDPTLLLLAVGQQTPEVSGVFASEPAVSLARQGRLHQINRYVTREEEQMVFAAADTVWLRYDRFYQMSGVLVKAVKAGLDLELPDIGLLGWYKGRNGGREPLMFREHDWDHALARLFVNSDKASCDDGG